MYGILILLTAVAFAGSIIIIYSISFDKDKQGKKHPWRLLLFIPVIWTGTVFNNTGSIINYDDVAKNSDEKWHTVYKNNINADVTITSGDMTLNPKKLITKSDKEKFLRSDDPLLIDLFSGDDPNGHRAEVTITATNKNDSTSKDAVLTEENFIERRPKGKEHDKSKGLITKIEYRSTPVTLKWFGLTVQQTSYDEARITVEYGATDDKSTAQLFGED